MVGRPTYNQLEYLVDFLEINPGIAKELIRTAYAKLQNKKKWEDLALSLNSLGGANKNSREWAKNLSVASSQVQRLVDTCSLTPDAGVSQNPQHTPADTIRIRRSQSKRRQRPSRHFDTEIDRLSIIEERRVEAELKTAEILGKLAPKIDVAIDALSTISISLSNMAAAMTSMAAAMSRMGAAQDTSV